MKILQLSPLKLSIILLSALICMSLFSARAYAAPQSAVSQCSGTKTTERKDGKDQAGNTLSCEWDKCTTTSCGSDGGTIEQSSCATKTEYSNPRNCTDVSATGTSQVRGRNRVRGAEQQMSAPVINPSGRNQNLARDQIMIIERGVGGGGGGSTSYSCTTPVIGDGPDGPINDTTSCSCTGGRNSLDCQSMNNDKCNVPIKDLVCTPDQKCSCNAAIVAPQGTSPADRFKLDKRVFERQQRAKSNKPKSGGESGFDEADALFGKRTGVKEKGSKFGKKSRADMLRAPSNLVISKVGSNKVTLTWKDNSIREFGVALYRMQPGPASRRNVRRPSWKYIGTFQERMSENTTGKGKRSDQDTGLTPGTKYCYRLQTYYGFDKSEVSDFSNTACTQTKISPRNAATTQTRNAATAQTRNVATAQKCGIKFGDGGKDSPWIKLKNNRITRTNDIGGPWSFIRETYGPCSFTVYNEKAFKGRKVRYGTDIKYRVRTGLVGGSRGGWRTRSVIIRPARQKKCKVILSVASNDSRRGGNLIGAQTFYGPDQHINIGASDYIHKTSGNCTFTLYNQDNFNGRIAVFNRVSSQTRIGWRARSLEIKPR